MDVCTFLADGTAITSMIFTPMIQRLRLGQISPLLWGELHLPRADGHLLQQLPGKCIFLVDIPPVSTMNFTLMILPAKPGRICPRHCQAPLLKEDSCTRQRMIPV